MLFIILNPILLILDARMLDSHNVEVTGHKLTAGFDSRGGLRSEATTGARRTKLAVNLWSGAETRWADSILKKQI
jgi:hypothetical protein